MLPTHNLNSVLEYIQILTDVIVQKLEPEKVILFGSFAYGNPTSSSDIDILVIVKNSPINRIERTGKLYVEMRNYYKDYSIDFLVYTEAEVEKWANASLAFITSVIKKGKTLYERKY
jgi:uncharacterized protein